MRHEYQPHRFETEFVRLLIARRVASELGATACVLLHTVVMAEDDAGYRHAVLFHDAHLCRTIGVPSVKALRCVRAKCIAAGWLKYTPSDGGDSGTYAVMVPRGFDCG